MNKKLFWLLTFLLLATVTFAQAQQPKKIPRVGFLVAPSRSFFSVRAEGFRQGLRNLGYIEAKNIVIEYRYAEGNLGRLPELAVELVSLKWMLSSPLDQVVWPQKMLPKPSPLPSLRLKIQLRAGSWAVWRCREGTSPD